MKLFSDSYRIAAALLSSVCLLWSCQTSDPYGSEASGNPVAVDMRIGADNVMRVRAFSNDDPLSVDRILVMPFTRNNSLAEDNANYKAAPELAVQMDVEEFPVTDLKILLSPFSTCRLVVLGFNRLNYDFYNSNPLTDDIVIHTEGSLSDLSIEYTVQADNNTLRNAELFYDISDPFRPGSGTDVSALLTRMVGGISVTLTNVPDGVEMRLYHTSSLTNRWEVAEGAAAGSFVSQASYYPMTNVGSGVSYYSRYYFPTDGDAPITMDIEAVNPSAPPAEAQIGRVTVATSEGSEFNVVANRAINLSGDYRSVILGQDLFVANPSDEGIHIDDDNWDGVDDTPETDPDGNPDPTVNS